MSKRVEWKLFVTPGLGDNSYLVVSGDEAAMVDPQRDAWRFLSVAESEKLKMRYVLETHVHNDYLSGAMEIRSVTGAEIAAPAKGNYEFSHKPMSEGEEIRIGAVRLIAIETPGHTPEHISWLLYEDSSDQPVAVFSGGSLIVGSAGRTDLLGAEWTEKLTRMQYHTIRRLATFQPGIHVLPTHGAGSFCTASGVSDSRITTLAAEMIHNPVLSLLNEEEFIRRQLQGLRSYPAYYPHMAGINRRGPQVLRTLPLLESLASQQVKAKQGSGVWVVDARDRKAFAEAHIPGSINIELDSSFGTYAGWVLPLNAPLLFVLPDPIKDSATEAVTQLIRIGFENLHGYLLDGMEAWTRQGFSTGSYFIGTIEDLAGDYRKSNQFRLLDVRQNDEWDAGHVNNSLHIPVGDLPGRLREIPGDQPVWVACRTGHRASIGASLLDRRGIRVRLLGRDGVPEFLEHYPVSKVE